MLKKEVLPNGIRLVGEELPNYSSVSVGVLVSCGSARENRKNNGISHFIEHMLFKGTKKRDAKQIVEEIESVGGSIDGFTSRESSGFWIKIPSSYIERAFDVLSDLLLHPRFDEESMKKEKDVVIEEIKGSIDSPQEFLSDTFTRNFWKGSPYGFPILGEKENVTSFSRKEILSYYKKNYFLEPFIVSIAGNFSFSEIKKLTMKYFGKISWGKSKYISPPSPPQRKTLFLSRPLEQMHFILGTQGVSQRSRLRFAFLVLENILGGGMSSRLFQKVREEKGLVYEIFSFHLSTKDTGLIAVYGGTGKDRIKEAVSLVIEEIKNIREKGVSEEEVRKNKDFLKGNLVISLESTQQRMSRLAHNEFYYSKLFTLEEVIKMIESVRKEEVDKVAKDIFKDEYFNLALLGSEKFDRNSIIR